MIPNHHMKKRNEVFKASISAIYKSEVQARIGSKPKKLVYEIRYFKTPWLKTAICPLLDAAASQYWAHYFDKTQSSPDNVVVGRNMKYMHQFYMFG